MRNACATSRTLNANGLTPRQQAILDWITDQPLMPSIREIGAAFRIRSTQGVQCHLKALERKGFIVRDPKRSRGIRVVGANDELLELLQLFQQEERSSTLRNRIDRQIERLRDQT
jgi:SOS-response transcriptional repressor LexA